MQCDRNGDLHLCAYLSQTFTSVDWNYDIYNHELLTVIYALDHWHHYLQETEHPITLLTNHKNLTYFCQPQKLSHQQVHWMMFLQDFDLLFVHTPSTVIGPTDILSCLPDPDTSSDNTNVTLLPTDLFIHAINVALIDKITSSSTSDPLVLDAMWNLCNGSPLFPCSSIADWHFDSSHLYFKIVSIFLLPPITISLPLYIHPLHWDMGVSSTRTHH